MKISVANPVTVAKRAMFLAYKASSVVGLGILQAQDDVTEEEVWNVTEPLPQKQRKIACGDYIYGRMTKLSMELKDDSVLVPDTDPQPSYESWCHKYPTYKALIDAAVLELSTETASKE